MSSLTQDQVKALEQSRQRLVQLTHSLSSLITSLNTSDPLPSWYLHRTSIATTTITTTRQRRKLLMRNEQIQVIPPIPSNHHLQ